MGRWKPVTAAEYVEARAYLVLAQERRDLRDKILAAQARILAPASSVEPSNEKLEVAARRRLRGNTLFWWCLGFDQMIHHLTHYVCIYLMLRLAGAL